MNRPETTEFMALVESARHFCRLIDRVPPGKLDWLDPVSRILPRLHAGIVALGDPGGGELPPEPMDIDARFDLFSQLRSSLGERDTYWLEFDDPDGLNHDDEHGTGSLADDLTDIYFELKRGLNMLGDCGPDAVAHLWELGFKQHWGQHLVDAERHLYSLKVNNRLQ